MVNIKSAFGIDSLGERRRLARHQHYSPVLNEAVTQLSAQGFVDAIGFATRRNPEAMRQMRRDPVIRKAIDLRLHMVVGTNLHFTFRDERSKILGDYYSELFDFIPNLEQARLNMASAVFEGMSWLRMGSPNVDSRFRLADDEVPRVWWYPGALFHYSPEMVREEYEDQPLQTLDTGETWKPRRYYWTYFDRPMQRWLEMPNDPMRPQWIQVNYHDNARSLLRGDGIIDAVYPYWQSKSRLIKALLEGIDRFGWPFIIAKVKAAAGDNTTIGDTAIRGDRRAEALIGNLEASAGQYKVIAVDPGDSVEALAADGVAIDKILRAIEYFDQKMVEAILASSMPTGGGEQGSFARAAIEQGSSSTLIRFDRKLHERGLQEIARAIKIYNEKNWRQIEDRRPKFAGGTLWHCKTPMVKIGMEQADSPEQQAKISRDLYDMGLPQLKKEVYEGVGRTMPADDDEVVMGAPGASAPQSDLVQGGARDMMNGQIPDMPTVGSDVARSFDEGMAGSAKMADGGSGDVVERYLREHREIYGNG